MSTGTAGGQDQQTEIRPVSDAHQLIPIPVEQDIHHIGDGEGFSSFLIPDAEGTSFETTFAIPSADYDVAGTAHLEFKLFDSDPFNSIVINGRSFSLPSNEKPGAVHLESASKMLISIPLGILESGTNTIGFESGQSSSASDYDDFEFGEVVLLLSS